MDDELRAAAMRFDPAVFAIARARMSSAPIELTEHDFSMLATVSPRLEDDARFAQKSAQLAIVQANTEKAATLVTKTAEPAGEPDDMAAWLQKHGTQPATYRALHDLAEALMEKWAEMNERNKERNTKIAALEQRAKEQDARLLELEAQRAVTHAGR